MSIFRKLGEWFTAKRISLLIVFLRAADAETSRKATDTLESFGAAAVNPLIAALKDKHENVRRCAAEVLGELKDARAVDPLIAALKDKHEYVREYAAGALGKIGDARAVEPLIPILKDEHKNVRWNTVGALGKIGDARAVNPLISALKDGQKDERKHAANVLGSFGAAAVDPLITALKDKHEDVRKYAAQALGELKDARAVDPLIAALKDKHEDVRKYAAGALGKIGDARAVEPLIAAIKGEKSFVIRRPYSDALHEVDAATGSPGKHNDDGIVKPIGVKNNWGETPLFVQRDPDLEQIFTDPNPQSPRQENAKWQQLDKDEKHVYLGMAYLSYPDAQIRAATIPYLKDVRSMSITNALADMLADSAKEVRSAAAKVVWERGTDPDPYKNSVAFTIRILRDELLGSGMVSHMSSKQAAQALELLCNAQPDRRDDFNKWVVYAWCDSKDEVAEHGYKLLAIYSEHQSFSGTAEEATRQVGVDIGNVRDMQAICEAIQLALGSSASNELKDTWKGVNGWQGQTRTLEVRLSSPQVDTEIPVNQSAAEMSETTGNASTCNKCGSQIDHFGFRPTDIIAIAQSVSYMKMIGGTCPKCKNVYCASCYGDNKRTCPGCGAKIPELDSQ